MEIGILLSIPPVVVDGVDNKVPHLHATQFEPLDYATSKHSWGYIVCISSQSQHITIIIIYINFVPCKLLLDKSLVVL